MRVICISGKARHGKDTVAGMLRDELTSAGYRVLIAHYGDLVKYVCKTFFGWDGEKDEYGRYLMQHVGTDIVRSKKPNFWTSFIIDILSMFHDKWDFVLLPDCRFPNEIDCIDEAGFPHTHIRIVRTGFSSPLSAVQQAHPSETSLDEVTPDVLIENSGDIGDLRLKVRDLVLRDEYKRLFDIGQF